MPRALLRLVPLLILLVFATHCALIDYYFLPPPEDTAQELYESGMEAMKDKKFKTAIELLTRLKDRYPFSPFTPKAEVALGDANFMIEQYLEAMDAYKEFEALHPSHEDTPYVVYQIAMSNLGLFKSIDLRQDNIREALEYLYRVEESYPGSSYAEAAKEQIVRCRRILAEHELFVADFFWRAEQYGSAWHRYRFVVENFSDLPDLRDYAKRRAEYSYYEYQKTLSQEERDEIQGSWLRWLKKWL